MPGTDCPLSSVSDGESPNIGTPAPDLRLTDQDGNEAILRDFRGRPVILIFFGDDWDPARTQHLAQYNELLQEQMRHSAIMAVPLGNPTFQTRGSEIY